MYLRINELSSLSMATRCGPRKSGCASGLHSDACTLHPYGGHCTGGQQQSRKEGPPSLPRKLLEQSLIHSLLCGKPDFPVPAWSLLHTSALKSSLFGLNLPLELVYPRAHLSTCWGWVAKGFHQLLEGCALPSPGCPGGTKQKGQV